MEIDLFGEPAPSCSFATSRIRLAVKRLPHNTWGGIDRWKCVWEPTGAFCRRHHVTIYASNPGG
jgi:hypothetical protein